MEFPDAGRVIPEYPHLGFRGVLVDPYRFFCRVKLETIWVVGVSHDAQIPNEPQEPAHVDAGVPQAYAMSYVRGVPS